MRLVLSCCPCVSRWYGGEVLCNGVLIALLEGGGYKGPNAQRPGGPGLFSGCDLP